MFYSSAHSHPHQQTPGINQRRSAGIFLVILIHVGLVVAIGSGLNVTAIFHEPPLFVVRTIDPPKINPPPPTPIDTSKFIEEISTTQTTPPIIIVRTDPIIDTPPIQPPPITGNTEPRGGRQVIEAKVDPRHPLTQPNYPPVSRRLGEEGTVELSLYILADGHIGTVRIDRSSGFARLDEAAQQHALTSWRLLPQQIDGVAGAGWQRITITFRLKK